MADDRLRVQSDEVGNVVRVHGEELPAELTPSEATQLAERLNDASRDVLTYRAAEQTENDENQQSLHEVSAGGSDDRESLAEMRARLTEDDRDRPELGEVRNENSPMKW